MGDRDAGRSGATAVGTKRKWFTVAEANRTLPLISRIVSDIVGQYARLQRLQARRRADSSPRDAAGAEECGPDESPAVQRLNDLIGELSRIGCRLKDVQAGLVDFPGRRNGRAILLCWKPNETRLSYWHEVYAGFAGRRPIDEACE